MFQLLYISNATQPLNDTDLVALLKQARKKNAGLNVTGMLLYKDAKFMQILEGDETAVRKLFAEISDDPRHQNITVIFQKRCPTAVFTDWSMGFINLDDEWAKSIPGYTSFLETPLDSAHFVDDPSLTMQFLYIFKFAKL